MRLSEAARALVPVWAARLAVEVCIHRVDEGEPMRLLEQLPEELRSLAEAPGPISAEAWRAWLELVATGARAGLREVRDDESARVRAGLSRALLKRYLRASPALRAAYSAAKRVALRLNWPRDRIDSVMDAVATGSSVRAAVGGSANDAASFVRLTMRDRALEAVYLAAKARYLDGARQALDTEAEEALDGVTDRKELRAATRKMNKAEHALLHLRPMRLINRERALRDPAKEHLVAARRRAAAARRRQLP